MNEPFDPSRQEDTSTDHAPGWRQAELGILAGIAHSLSGALGGITLATELARMDNELPDHAYEVLDLQLRRLQDELRVLVSVLELERTSVQLHDPVELVRSAVRLFERLPAETQPRIRTTRTPDVTAVEVAAGPCIRALVLCMHAFSASSSRTAAPEIMLHIDRVGTDVAVAVRCGSPALTPARDVLDAAASLVGAAGGRIEADREQATLIMQPPQ